jgi:hypothetical protein
MRRCTIARSAHGVTFITPVDMDAAFQNIGASETAAHRETALASLIT